MTPRSDRRWNGRTWEYEVIDHIDGDPRNNDLANLRRVWVPENSDRCIRCGEYLQMGPWGFTDCPACNPNPARQ